MQVGTDIEDFKCSWLFVQALQRADEKQKDFLFVRPVDYIFDN